MSKDKMFLTGDTSFEDYMTQEIDDTERMIPRGQAIASSRTFVNHDTNISVKSDYNYRDYEYFRPSTTVPIRKEDIIAMCMIAYKKVGLVRNVIDLMGDFGTQGIRLQHPNPNIQQFYKTWAEKVGFEERSERFLNNLYRCGQTIIKKSYGNVSKYQEQKMKKGVAQDIKLQKVKTKSREIPLRYTYINPLSVQVLGGEIAQFVGHPALGLKLSAKLRSAVATALKTDKLSAEVKKMLDKIPKDVLAAIKRGDSLLPLDSDKINVYYYKKDDWELWADPICYCILDDLLMLNQLKLADRSALDGAISNTRLWTLGIIGDSPANSILPTKTAINKLRSILANNVGGGTVDLVWGPELTFTESNSQVWRWLGSEKYEVTISAIYEGLGIPSSLRGSTSGSTNTGNFIGLNTLVKRLEYGRSLLTDFWNSELKYIHKAMGFGGKPPQIMFNFMSLADEAAERQLLIHLWDRDIISDATILELFGRLPTVEKARVNAERTARDNKQMVSKAGPYHNPEKEHDYKKLVLQDGSVTPSEIGLELLPKKPGEKSRLQQMQTMQTKLKNIDKKQPGTSGRPDGVKETQKRKPKPTEKPSTKASVDIVLWANMAQEEISTIVTPSLLYAFDKKDMRSLSKEEFDEIESLKFNMLCYFEPFDTITAEKVHDALLYSKNTNLDQSIAYFKSRFIAQYERKPKIDEMRQIYSYVYALQYEEI